MKISCNLLKTLISFDWPTDELADRLTMSGSEVESIEQMGADIDGVIAARVTSVENIAGSDKLTMCRVYDGKENCQVVCGAPNVAKNQVVLFAPPGSKIPGMILEKAVSREGFKINEEARDFITRYSSGDARRMLNLLQAALGLGKPDLITIEDVEGVIGKQPLLYDRDEDYHYDVISAFIKSVRGSDPDAALYWLALMLESGEDPLYIARRLAILASEDIGLADSSSLVLAVSAYEAVDMVGMPEARLILAHVTLHLTLAMKSNSSYRAISKATAFIKERGNLEVPDYLKSAHPAKKNYLYPPGS